jgi:hypothetical protein
LERGHSLKELVAMTSTEMLFLMASMILTREEEAKKYGEQKY